MLILALDLGTTGNRAIIFDQETRVLASSYQEFTQIYPQPGWVEHDPVEIWNTAQSVIRDAVSQVDPNQIAAVGITNQRETIVAWDPKTGVPFHNAIVWQDRRTAARCEALKSEGKEEDIRTRTGLVCDAYFSATKIEWLLQNVPETRTGLFGTIDSWILWNLTPQHLHLTDVSNASRTMLFHLGQRSWDETLLQTFGVARECLPEVRATISDFGVLDKGLFGFTAPIRAVAGDQQASMFAQGCYQPGMIKNTYGTGLFLMQNTGPSQHRSQTLVSTLAWQIGPQVDYAVEGSVFIGGAAIQWLRDQLHLVASAPETEQLARGLPSNDGVYFVPALSGLGAPYWDPHARGTILGLTRSTSAAHLVRAALEAIAYQTRDVADVMCEELGSPLTKLQVDGGACANDFLMQFQADILGVPVERPEVIETTALGAAALAGLSVNAWASPQDFLAHRRIEKTFLPEMTEPVRNRLYGNWQKAVQRAGSWAE